MASRSNQARALLSASAMGARRYRNLGMKMNFDLLRVAYKVPCSNLQKAVVVAAVVTEVPHISPPSCITTSCTISDLSVAEVKRYQNTISVLPVIGAARCLTRKV